MAEEMVMILLDDYLLKLQEVELPRLHVGHPIWSSWRYPLVLPPLPRQHDARLIERLSWQRYIFTCGVDSDQLTECLCAVWSHSLWWAHSSQRFPSAGGTGTISITPDTTLHSHQRSDRWRCFRCDHLLKTITLNWTLGLDPKMSCCFKCWTVELLV